jgi:excisionase family DNA binding protein
MRNKFNSTQDDTLVSPLDGRKTLSLPEVAKLLGFDHETVRKYAMHGDIPGAFQVRKGAPWRFKRKQLEAWWASLG